MLLNKQCCCSLLTTFLLVWFTALADPASAEDGESIITKVVHNLNGETAIMEIEMVIKTSRVQRSMRMKSYSQGQEKSFIKVLYPKKDTGITFLKINNTMWQYVPRIEKIIKIPSSMMLQSWMGSDFTNDDLVKESSLKDDYNVRLLQETADSFQLELQPKIDAAVVWGKIMMVVSKKYYLPQTVSYFDEDGILVRKLLYTDVQAFGTRFYPSRWVMTPKSSEKKGHETRITVLSAIFDSSINEDYFSKRALKRFSR